MSAQMWNEQAFSSAGARPRHGELATSTMSLAGTVAKAFALLVVDLGFGALGWSVGRDWFSTSSGLWWLIDYFILIGLSVVAVFYPDLALPVGLLFAVLAPEKRRRPATP